MEVSQELQDQIIAEQNRLAEIARQQEAKRKAAAAAAERRANGGGSSGGTVHAPQSNGTWIKPTNGRLTSPYGWRNLGAGPEFHYGVDLANATGTPIWAQMALFLTQRPLSSYGNVVIVTHSIDGQIYTTVYAHLSAFNVSVGQEVTQGQQIATMGSTGRSTGPHLHFEVHIGPWKGQAVGSVNPLKYIPL